MRHACEHCGATPGAQAWATGDTTGDTKAIDSLEAQAAAADARGDATLAGLLRVAAAKIKAQRDWLEGLGVDLDAAVAAVVLAIIADLRRARGRTVPERVRSMGITEAAIQQALAAQMAGRRDRLDDTLADLVKLTNEQINAGASGAPSPAPATGPTGATPPSPAPGASRVPSDAARRAADRVEQRLWVDAIIKPAAQRIQDGLDTGAPTDDLDTLADRIERNSGVSRGTAVTEARTQLAEFDRAVTVAGAEETGAGLYAYFGPDDAITRPFCAELVGFAFTPAQVAKMNNAQTIAPPIVSGGGYNCRHSWSPITEATASAMGLPRGTMAKVDTANRRARARR